MTPSSLPTEFVLPLEWEKSRQIIVDRESETADVVNDRESGYYDSIETLSGQQFFASSNPQNPRLVFRKVIDFGSLPNSATKTVAHGISGITRITRLYGAATGSGSYLPLPYVGSNTISLEMDNSNIIITTTSNRSAYNAYVVVEYLKN